MKEVDEHEDLECTGLDDESSDSHEDIAIPMP